MKISKVVLGFMAMSLLTTPEPVKAAADVGYKGGFYIKDQDGDFSLKTGGYIQGLFLTEIFDAATPDTYTFRVRRARLKFKGNVFSPEVIYQLEYDFVSPKLLSTFVGYKPNDDVKITAGQFKVPFNFEGRSSSSTLQFVDRSLLHATFGVPDEREIGLGVYLSWLEKMIEAELGIFNGDGLTTANVDDKFRYAGRIILNIMGHHGYKFSDTKHSDEPHLAFAVGGFYNETPEAAPATGNVETAQLTGDVSLKYNGLGGHAAVIYRNNKPDSAANTDDVGWLAQAGYFFIPNKFEAALRAVNIYPEGGADLGEYSVVLNFFAFGNHKVKLQGEYSLLTTDDGVAVGDDALDHRGRVQLQVKL